MIKKNTRILFDIGQGLSIAIGLPKIDSWDIAGRPKNAKRGTFGFNSETNNLEYCDGNGWLAASMDEA